MSTTHMNEVDPDLIKALINLFPAYTKAYGQTTIKGQKPDGKVETNNRTIHGTPGSEHWRAHLLGQSGLGLIPLRCDNKVFWGVIDIDIPGMDLHALELKAQEHKFPLHVFRSKSGGAHCYLFVTEAVPAQEMIRVLTMMAERLGHRGCEIFPKQMYRATEEDVGNYINMPFFGHRDTNRFLLHKGQPTLLPEAIAILEAGKITPDELRALCPESGAPAPDPRSKPAAGRNDYLFKAVLRLHDLDFDNDTLREIAHLMNARANADMHPNFSDGPLPEREVDQIVKSVMKFDKKVAARDDALDPDEALIIMDNNYAIVREGGKTVVIAVDFDETLKRQFIVRSSIQDIRNFHVDPVLVGFDKGKPIHKPLGVFWTRHPKARRFKQVVFLPGAEAKPGQLNLWLGFAIDPVKGDCSLFHDHLLNNVCSGNQEYYEYFLNWIARMFQQPDKQGEVIIALRGGRGTGKSIIAKILTRLIGQHAIHISNGHHLTGNFNAHLQDVIFIFSDEAFWAGDKSGEGTLKTLATEPTIFIEPKGINGFQVPNRLHIMMASNHEWMTPAGPDERRFFVLDVGDGRKQDTEYFAALLNQMENGGYEALMYELLNRDISGFEVRRFPQTSALNEQKLFSLTPIQRWWLDILMNGLLPEDDGFWSGIVSRKGLQESYIRSMKDTGQGRKSSQTQLGAQLKHLVPAKADVRKELPVWNHAAKEYVVQSVPAYQFPDLQTCRAFFEAQTQTRYEWPPASMPAKATPEPESEPEIPF